MERLEIRENGKKLTVSLYNERVYVHSVNWMEEIKNIIVKNADYCVFDRVENKWYFDTVFYENVKQALQKNAFEIDTDVSDEEFKYIYVVYELREKYFILSGRLGENPQLLELIRKNKAVRFDIMNYICVCPNTIKDVLFKELRNHGYKFKNVFDNRTKLRFSADRYEAYSKGTLGPPCLI